ncbi:MAG: microviridin/marinostatin family tricyclic proteinase inhibitor [Pseudomonadales bacterium]
MSDLKIKDLPPAPFFARFLEGQFDKEMTREEMQAVQGGTMVTNAFPSDQEGVPGGYVPEDIAEWIRRAREGFPSMPDLPSMPGYPKPPGSEMVTLAAPSDSDMVEVEDV